MATAVVPDLTAEQQLAIRLEGVFMPQARKQRDEFFNSDPDPRFVHYTSADSALKIITSKRIWMRSTVCMSDYREIEHGYDILSRYFHPEKSNFVNFCNALDASVPGAAKEAFDLFNGWWHPGIRFHTYIASISEHRRSEDLHGRLSMWRAVGKTSTRVAIVFRAPRISGGADALKVMFSPVAYLTEAQVQTVLDEVIMNIQAEAALLRSLPRQTVVGLFFQTLRVGVACLKHDGYSEEREWRAIYSPKLAASKLMGVSTQVIGGVPQIFHELPLDVTVEPVLADLDLARMFDRLIIGASQFPLPIADAFTEALSKAGVSDAGNRVVVSGIPIRS